MSLFVFLTGNLFSLVKRLVKKESMWVAVSDDSLSSVTRYASPVVCFSCTLEIFGSQRDDDIILPKTHRRLYELVSARLNVYGSGFFMGT